MLHEKIAQSAMRHLAEGCNRIEKCLELTNDKTLWEHPNESLVSIGNLIQHVCGNVSQHILRGIGGEGFVRDRDSEFEKKEMLSRAQLVANVRDVVERACSVIGRMTSDDFERTFTIQGFTTDGVAVVAHVVEHFSYHVGQITYAVKLRENVSTGYYEGKDLNIP
ncbi:MAG: DUF1572 family protein [Planctomycetota bacterium]|nr:DUF1572 family protein [Planctomycetota bacterium]